jgi:hypothetical protein
MTCPRCLGDGQRWSCGDADCVEDGKCRHGSASMVCECMDDERGAHDHQRQVASPAPPPAPPRPKPLPAKPDDDYEPPTLVPCATPGCRLKADLGLFGGRCVVCASKLPAKPPKASGAPGRPLLGPVCGVYWCGEQREPGRRWCASHWSEWRDSRYRIRRLAAETEAEAEAAELAFASTPRVPGDAPPEPGWSG